MLLMMLLWSCSVGIETRMAPAPVAQLLSEDEVLQAVLDGFMDALNSCDLERTMAFFAPDATMFFPLPETALRAEDKDAIAAVFADFYAQVRDGKPGPKYMALVPQNARIQRFGEGAVISFQIAKGPVTSRRSITLRRQDGRWQIIHFHASNVRQESEE